MNPTFEEFYKTHGQRIYGRLRKNISNEHDAEDIFQDVCLKVYNFLEKNEEIHRFSNWTNRVTSNALCDFGRKRKISTLLEDICEKEIAVTENLEKKTKIAKEIINLPQRYKEVIDSHYQEELSFDEIAKKLNISKKNVKIRIYRAKKILKKKCIPA